MTDIPAKYLTLRPFTPPTPAAGTYQLYTDGTGALRKKMPDGTTAPVEGGGGAHPDFATHQTMGLGAAAHVHVPDRQRLLIHSPLLAASPWTNMPLALSFFFGTASAAKHIQKIDLTGYSQVRLLVFKSAVAGTADSKLILLYASAFSQTAGDYSNIGTSEVSVAINVQNTFLDTGFIDLAAGAKADVFVALLGSGGNSALDPQFGIIEAEFK